MGIQTAFVVAFLWNRFGAVSGFEVARVTLIPHP